MKVVRSWALAVVAAVLFAGCGDPSPSPSLSPSPVPAGSLVMELGDFRMVPVDGTEPTPMDVPKDLGFPVWNADGSSFAYSPSGSGNLFVVIGDQPPRSLGNNYFAPRWAPDGKSLLAVRTDLQCRDKDDEGLVVTGGDIVRLDPRTGDVIEVVVGCGGWVGADEGGGVVVADGAPFDTPGHLGLWTIVDGVADQRIDAMDTIGGVTTFDLSPDGLHLAILSAASEQPCVDSRHSVYTVDVANDVVIAELGPALWTDTPFWSPGGDIVAVTGPDGDPCGGDQIGLRADLYGVDGRKVTTQTKLPGRVWGWVT